MHTERIFKAVKQIRIANVCTLGKCFIFFGAFDSCANFNCIAFTLTGAGWGGRAQKPRRWRMKCMLPRSKSSVITSAICRGTDKRLNDLKLCAAHHPNAPPEYSSRQFSSRMQFSNMHSQSARSISSLAAPKNARSSLGCRLTSFRLI